MTREPDTPSTVEDLSGGASAAGGEPQHGRWGGPPCPSTQQAGGHGGPPHRHAGRRTHALIALLLLVLVPSIGTAMGLWIAPGPVGKTVYFISKLWILALPAVWLLWVERGRVSFSPARRGGFGFGVGSGLAISAAIGVVYYFISRGGIDSAALRELGVANGFDKAAVYWGFAAYLILVNSVLEEYVWRWFVYTRCEMLMPAGVAVLAAAAFFAIHHVIALGSFLPWSLAWLGAGGVFVGGAIWSWSYRRYRSVWPGYVSHAIVDAAVLMIGWRMLGS